MTLVIAVVALKLLTRRRRVGFATAKGRQPRTHASGRDADASDADGSFQPDVPTAAGPRGNAPVTHHRAYAHVHGGSLHAEKGEDRIYHGFIAKSWPVVIVADGVSIEEDPATGSTISGRGGLAADEAVKTARLYLDDEIPGIDSVQNLALCLGELFDAVVDSLRETCTPGATTLLVALLWRASPIAPPFWCYAYEGNGFIDLLSPARAITGKILPERLLSPQQVEVTAALRGSGMTVRPAVGCRLFEPDDLLYVASDGILPLDPWLRGHVEYRTTFTRFLLDYHTDFERMSAILSDCPHFNDDAVLGMISARI
jgi:hypothetical protein